MANQYVVQLVLLFVLRQLGTYGEQIDWTLVKADLAQRIPALIPGMLLDSFFTKVGLSIADGLADVLKGGRLNLVLAKLAAGDVDGAMKDLQNMLKNFWRPTGEHKDAAATLVDTLSAMDKLPGMS